MIKLTINPDAEATICTFDKQEIVIGNETSTHADIQLCDESLKDIHVKIIKDENRFLIINSAHDPFTSLNGLPFGKKTIHALDRIQIHQTIIQFENEEKTEIEELETIDIDALMKEVEELEHTVSEVQEEEEPPVQEEEKNTPAEIEEAPKPVELLPCILDDKFDEKRRNKKPKRMDQPPVILKNWRKLTGLFIAFLLVSTMICSGIYFRASGKNSQEEKKIGAGIADIAMAITHAQLNHITPTNQNWSHPDFIHNNIAVVLSPNLHTQAQIDNQGRFDRYPYILRIYTRGNMSRFLVIAQPAPNLLQWIVHKKTIVIDSTAMEMRKITDIKRLNRLLANPNPLKGRNGEEISEIVKEGTLMSLDSLSGNKNHWGVTPPKALGLMRPGAENYIYNAPRYYPFGESLLKKAIYLSQNPDNTAEATALREEMMELSQYPNLVLYTSQGLQSALEAQKALGALAPKSHFLVAYVKFNTKGYVASSHILMKEEHQDIALLDQDVTTSTQDSPTEEEPSLDTDHALFLQLQKDLAETLTQLYEEHSDVSLEDFIIFVEAADLSTFIREAIKMQRSDREETITVNVPQLDMIHDAGNLSELDDVVHETSAILNLDKIPDPDRLMAYQEMMHHRVLDKISEFLFSPESVYVNTSFDEGDRNRLIAILTASWVTESEEFDYFLSEFDLLASTDEEEEHYSQRKQSSLP